MSAVELDSNMWYTLSQTRLTNASEPITACLQQTAQGPRGLHCDNKEEMAWQFQPVESRKERYVLRLKSTGVRQQFSVCWDANEVSPRKNRACMRRTDSEDPQMWDILDWGDGTFDVSNAANGTGYLLDAHPGSNLFMSDDIEGTGSHTLWSPAQRWVMTSDRPVNDRAYSTIYSSESTATPSVTPTGTPSSSSSSPPGRSSGAAAGLGVGVSLAVIALAGAGLSFWWRRRRATRGTSGTSDDMPKLGPDSAYVHVVEADDNPMFEAPSDRAFNEAARAYYKMLLNDMEFILGS